MSDVVSDLPVVLVVDDEIRSQEVIRRTLSEEFEVLTVSSATQAEALLEREWVQIVLCDQRMPGTTGVEFLCRVRERWPEMVRMIISGYTDTGDIIAGINQAGIYQYITKPWQPEALLIAVRSAAELWRLQHENRQLTLELRASAPVVRSQVAEKRQEARRHAAFDTLAMAPESPLAELCETARQVAQYHIPLLITGESGTGKELLTRAIHYASPRAGRALVVENCAALADQILESELFGHKRGAFTGAYEDRVGLFEQANGGTIFLDEIGETSPTFQVKLLRVLQEVRVISATNRDLREEVRRGRFREDLYYRLAAFTLTMPPLRERASDIPAIAQRILAKAQLELGKRADFSRAALAALSAYRWPGNVRELNNEIYRALALARDPTLGAELLSPHVLHAASDEQEQQEIDLMNRLDGTLKDRLDGLEARIIKACLARHRWNKSRAAKELGLSRVGLRAKLSRYNLEPEA